MNEFTGSIIELNNKQAFVMTDSCDFVSIVRTSGMFVGQQVKFKKSDIIKNNRYTMKYFTLVASIFLIALCSVFYFQIISSEPIYAYVDIDINPSIELSIDKSAVVLAQKPLNEDAQKLLTDIELVDLPLKDAIAEIVEASKQLGYISPTKKNAVLVSASLYNQVNNSGQNTSHEITLDNILSDISNIAISVGSESINPKVFKVTTQDRKTAIGNNISMGRYVLYSIMKQNNNDITVEKAKIEPVSEMINETKIKAFNKNKSIESKSIDKTSKGNTSKNNASTDISSKGNTSTGNPSKGNASNDTSSKNTDSEDIDRSKKTNKDNSNIDNNKQDNKENNKDIEKIEDNVKNSDNKSKPDNSSKTKK